MLRLLIPVNNPQILSQWDKNLKVYEISGSGSAGASSAQINLELGYMQTRALNQFKLNFRAKGIDYCKTMGEISDWLTANKILNGTISHIKVLDKVGTNICQDGYLISTFKKHTPHRNIDIGRVVNGGSFPDQQLYQFLSTIREQMPKSDRQKFKSSILRLVATEPNPKVLMDEEAVKSIKRHYMKTYMDNVKSWNITHPDFKSAGRLKELMA